MKKAALVLLVMLVVSGCAWNKWEKIDGNTDTDQRKSDWRFCNNDSVKAIKKITLAPPPLVVLPLSPQDQKAMDQRFNDCMNAKGYQLKERNPVYVGFDAGNGSVADSNPAFKYFHKKDCKHLWSVSIEEITVGEATARGKSMCPDCFRD